MIRLITLAWDVLRWMTGFGPDNISSVETTDITARMVGRWGIRGDVILIVERVFDQIEFLPAYNEAWRMKISNAKLVGESIHFVQRNYCRKSLLHPFNGVACKFVITMLDDDRLELRMAFTSPEILTRIE